MVCAWYKTVERDNRCWEIASDENLDWSTAAIRGNTHRLTDVWSLLRPGDPGFTFSNLPWAGTTQHTRTQQPCVGANLRNVGGLAQSTRTRTQRGPRGPIGSM